MLATVCKVTLMAVISLGLAGCGSSRSTSDDSATALVTLRLDFNGRAAMNTAGHEMNALSVPTLVRVYQVRSRVALQKASYDSLVADSGQLPGADVLAEQSLVVRPGEGAQLNMPLAGDARFVAVVGLFRDPDLHEGSWRVILDRSELNPIKARVLELGDNRLTLLPVSEG